MYPSASASTWFSSGTAGGGSVLERLQHLFRDQSEPLRIGAADEHRADFTAGRGFLPRLEAVADPVPRSDQRGLVDERVRHQRLSLLAVTREESVLDLHRSFLVTQTLHVVIVEVLVACTHAADVERQ